MSNGDVSITENQRVAIIKQVIANAFTTRSQFLEQLIDPRRDLDKECGWPRSFTARDYRNLVEREGLALRIVNLFPDECFKQAPDIYETEDVDQDTPFENELKDLVDKM